MSFNTWNEEYRVGMKGWSKSDMISLSMHARWTCSTNKKMHFFIAKYRTQNDWNLCTTATFSLFFSLKSCLFLLQIIAWFLPTNRHLVSMCQKKKIVQTITKNVRAGASRCFVFKLLQCPPQLIFIFTSWAFFIFRAHKWGECQILYN